MLSVGGCLIQYNVRGRRLFRRLPLGRPSAACRADARSRTLTSAVDRWGLASFVAAASCFRSKALGTEADLAAPASAKHAEAQRATPKRPVAQRDPANVVHSGTEMHPQAPPASTGLWSNVHLFGRTDLHAREATPAQLEAGEASAGAEVAASAASAATPLPPAALPARLAFGPPASATPATSLLPPTPPPLPPAAQLPPPVHMWPARTRTTAGRVMGASAAARANQKAKRTLASLQRQYRESLRQLQDHLAVVAAERTGSGVAPAHGVTAI